MSKTVLDEWLELERRMKKYLLNNIESKDRISPFRLDRRPEDVDDFEAMRSYLHDYEDLDFQSHKHYDGRLNPKCQIEESRKKSANDASNAIINMVEKDLFYLFDPCTKLAIWNAYHLDDKQFINGLSKAILASFAKEQPTKQNTHIVRNFLIQLESHGLIELSFGKEEWDKAFEIVEKLRLKKPALKQLKTAVKLLRGPKLFEENCKKWF